MLTHIKAKRFRKLPVEIEAMQWDGKNISEVIDWIEAGVGGRFNNEVLEIQEIHNEDQESLKLITDEGTVHVDIYDWIIRSAWGEFYSCNPEKFEKTYEIVDDESCSHCWLKMVSKFQKGLQKRQGY